MSLLFYFPETEPHPKVEAALCALLGDTPPQWSHLAPHVQDCILILRTITHEEESDLQRCVSDLEAEIEWYRRYSLLKAPSPTHDG